MRYKVTAGKGRERSIVLGLSTADIDGLLAGGVLRVRMDKFGVPEPFGKRLYVLSMETDSVTKLRANKTLPTEWGRLDCIPERHLREIRDSGHQMDLPRDRNGIQVSLANEGSMALGGQPRGDRR